MKAVRCTLLCLGFTCAASAARATGERSFQLDWHVAQELDCPSAADFRAAVAARLGYAPFNEDAATAVRVELTSSAPTQLRLSLIAPDGSLSAERQLTDARATCTGLLDGALFALEVMVSESASDAEGQTSTAEDAPSAPRVSAPPPVVEDMSATESGQAPTPVGPSDPAFEIGMLGNVFFGVLPATVYGASLHGGVAWSAGWSATAELGFSTQARSELSVGTSQAVLDLQLWRASVAAGYALWTSDVWRFQLAGVAHVGALATTVSGVDQRGARFHGWGAVGVRAALSARLSSWIRVLAVLDGLIPLGAREFGVVDGPVIARLSPASGVVSLGIGADF